MRIYLRWWKRSRLRRAMRRTYRGPPPPSHPMCRCEPDPTDTWGREWQRTLVTPLFVGGPGDGKRLEPRPRCELPLRIRVPVLEKGLKVRTADEPLPTRPPIGSVTYRMGVYVDAFTVEYR